MQGEILVAERFLEMRLVIVLILATLSQII